MRPVLTYPQEIPQAGKTATGMLAISKGRTKSVAVCVVMPLLGPW